MTRRSLALAALVLGPGCTEYGYTSQTQIDVFQQNKRNTVDVLVVVDNSCSMVEEQEKLASNFQSFIAALDGVDVDWQLGVTTTDTRVEEFQGRIMGGDDEIELSCDGRTIDRVAWDWDWSVTEGVALALSSDAMSSTSNDSQSNWCAATDTYGDGDAGTPGAANGSCSRWAADTGGGDTGGGDTGGGDTGEDTGSSDVSAPSAGKVIITEFMADPAAVDDAVGEWIELANIGDVDVDLSDCVLSDDGRNSASLPSGTTLASGAVLVVGRSASDNGGLSPDVVVDDGLTLNNAVRILTPDTAGAEEIFGEMVAVGITGSGIEMGLEAAALALSEPLLSDHNAGLVRDDANLSLIFVSDENDYSPHGVNTYFEDFGKVKGDAAFRQSGVLVVSAVVGSDAPAYQGEFSCESDDGTAAYGHRYVDLASRTGGAVESICDEDFSPIAYELGLTLSGLELVFELSEAPDTASLLVKLYETSDEKSFIDELTLDQDYSYDLEQNAIVFDTTQTPPAETYIVVEYEVLASGSTVTESSDDDADADARMVPAGPRRQVLP